MKEAGGIIGKLYGGISAVDKKFLEEKTVGNGLESTIQDVRRLIERGESWSVEKGINEFRQRGFEDSLLDRKEMS